MRNVHGGKWGVHDRGVSLVMWFHRRKYRDSIVSAVSQVIVYGFHWECGLTGKSIGISLGAWSHRQSYRDSIGSAVSQVTVYRFHWECGLIGKNKGIHLDWDLTGNHTEMP